MRKTNLHLFLWVTGIAAEWQSMYMAIFIASSLKHPRKWLYTSGLVFIGVILLGVLITVWYVNKRGWIQSDFKLEKNFLKAIRFGFGFWLVLELAFQFFVIFMSVGLGPIIVGIPSGSILALLVGLMLSFNVWRYKEPDK